MYANSGEGARNELGAHFLEGIGDIFDEDETEHNMLVFRRIYVIAQLVSGEPELGFEADVGGRIVDFSCCCCHQTFPELLIGRRSCR